MAGVRAGVEDDAESGTVDALFLSDTVGDTKAGAHKLFIGFADVRGRGDVLSGNDEKVGWSLRIDVFYSNDIIIGVEDG